MIRVKRLSERFGYGGRVALKADGEVGLLRVKIIPEQTNRAKAVGAEAVGGRGVYIDAQSMQC